MKNIKKITALESFLVRYPVFQAKKPMASCCFDGDTLETRLLDYNNILGVIFLFEAKNDSFTLEKQFQFKGMAV